LSGTAAVSVPLDDSRFFVAVGVLTATRPHPAGSAISVAVPGKKNSQHMMARADWRAGGEAF
jgi:hypothetical protein